MYFLALEEPGESHAMNAKVGVFPAMDGVGVAEAVQASEISSVRSSSTSTSQSRSYSSKALNSLFPQCLQGLAQLEAHSTSSCQYKQ